MEREYEFSLVCSSPNTLDDDMANALYGGGCDDATISMQAGVIYIEFNRLASSLQRAVISAIEDVQNSGADIEIVRVDDCDMVTQADISRRIGRSRQLVHQYITGQRGPGHFPPPACRIAEKHPLWEWCEVSAWLASHDIIKTDENMDAEVVAVINNLLEVRRQRLRQPELVESVRRQLAM